jgi:hypothetical protein
MDSTSSKDFSEIQNPGRSNILKDFSKPVKQVIKTVSDRVEKGHDAQLAFKEECVSVGLSGTEMKIIEKRVDIAAILYDEYEIDVNPISLDEGIGKHTAQIKKDALKDYPEKVLKILESIDYTLLEQYTALEQLPQYFDFSMEAQDKLQKIRSAILSARDTLLDFKSKHPQN